MTLWQIGATSPILTAHGAFILRTWGQRNRVSKCPRTGDVTTVWLLLRSFILEGPRPSLCGAPSNDPGLVGTGDLLDSFL